MTCVLEYTYADVCIVLKRGEKVSKQNYIIACFTCLQLNVTLLYICVCINIHTHTHTHTHTHKHTHTHTHTHNIYYIVCLATVYCSDASS
jgi:hypothetical protein